MCEVLKVSRSGYYAWESRQPSIRQRDNEELLRADTEGSQSKQKALWESADHSGAQEAGGSMWEEPCGQDHERALDMGRSEEKEIQADHRFTA